MFGFTHERYEQVEFTGREIDAFVVAIRRTRRDVDVQIGVAIMLRRFEPRAPQRRSDAREKFLPLEGLRDVVVRAAFEAVELGLLFVERRKHQNRRFGQAPKHRKQSDPVDFRQHDVEHDRIGRPLARDAQARLAVGRGANFVAFVFERYLEERTDVRLVVDDEDP